MSKAGKKLLSAAHEAVAIAKGEIPAARITIKGHAYVPAAEVKRLRSVTARLLESYLLSFDGNKDALALEAEALLRRRAR